MAAESGAGTLGICGVFGRVVSGMEVVDAIGDRATGPGGPFRAEVPAAPVIIERVLRVTE